MKMIVSKGKTVLKMSKKEWEDMGEKQGWNKKVESKKKGKPVNPWAVCTKSVGREDKDKYEKCVMDVKSEHPIKKD